MHLSPDHTNFPDYLWAVGFAHFAAGRYEDAIKWSKRSMRAGGTSYFCCTVASSYAHLGRLADARAASELLPRGPPGYSLLADLELTNPAIVPSLRERLFDGLRMAGMKE